MDRFIINDDGHVVYLSNSGDKILPLPPYGAKAVLLAEIPGQSVSLMYYFLVNVLKLPDDRRTMQIGNYLVLGGLTPKMLCHVDLDSLLGLVRGIGPASIEVLKKAIRDYYKRRAGKSVKGASDGKTASNSS